MYVLVYDLFFQFFWDIFQGHLRLFWFSAVGLVGFLYPWIFLVEFLEDLWLNFFLLRFLLLWVLVPPVLPAVVVFLEISTCLSLVFFLFAVGREFIITVRVELDLLGSWGVVDGFTGRVDLGLRRSGLGRLVSWPFYLFGGVFLGEVVIFIIFLGVLLLFDELGCHSLRRFFMWNGSWFLSVLVLLFLNFFVGRNTQVIIKSSWFFLTSTHNIFLFLNTHPVILFSFLEIMVNFDFGFREWWFFKGGFDFLLLLSSKGDCVSGIGGCLPSWFWAIVEIDKFRFLRLGADFGIGETACTFFEEGFRLFLTWLCHLNKITIYDYTNYPFWIEVNYHLEDFYAFYFILFRFCYIIFWM